MSQLKQLLASLTLRQKISIAAAVLLVGGLLFGLLNWRKERDFKPLYSGLSQEDASAVVQKLKETGIEYRLGPSGSSVLAPSSKVAETRLLLAGAGLPKSGRIGFELFDKTNFGVTDFTEHVNYRRALEGELERSIMSIGEVEHARVHITFPKESVFVESRQPAKASVILRLRTGERLPAAAVSAITYMVSNAVEGLAPEAVAVLDTRGALLNRPRRSDADGADAPDALIEYRQTIERDLLAKVDHALEPVLGADKYRVGASVECDFSTNEESEETYDPEHSVMATSQKTEESTGASGSSGVPGTASNLPRPTSRPGSSGSGLTRRTENITYQTARRVRHTRLPKGSIKRISLAVLVDHSTRWEGSGAQVRRILDPPSPERLKVVRDVVAGIAGINPSRGDQLFVDAIPFETTLKEEAPPAASLVPSPSPQQRPGLPAFLSGKPWILPAIGGGILILIVALALALRRVGRRRPVVEIAPQIQSAPAAPAIASAESVENAMAAKLTENEAVRAKLESEAISSLKLPAVSTKKTEVLTKYLRDEVKKDTRSSAQLVRAWLYEDEG